MGTPTAFSGELQTLAPHIWLLLLALAIVVTFLEALALGNISREHPAKTSAEIGSVFW